MTRSAQSDSDYRMPDAVPEPPDDRAGSRQDATSLSRMDAGLPANPDAERTILGSVLLDNDSWHEIQERLKPNDFSLDSHRRIALRMGQLLKRNSAVDLVTLAHELNANHEVEAVGGVAYLASLTEGLPRRPVIGDYIAICKDKSILRRTMALCSAAIARAAEQSEPALEVVGSLQSGLEQITEGTIQSTSGPIAKFIADAMGRDAEEYRDKSGRHIPSGNAWFDAKTGGGYRTGRITLVCARPGVGKSSWAWQSVAYNCMRGTRCVVFSLEMEKEEVLRGLIPYVVNVPAILVDRPELRTPEVHAQIQMAYSLILEDWEHLLSVYDDEMDIDKICWTMDTETSKGNEDKETLFVLDHFGLISGGAKIALDRETENSGRLRAKIKKKRHAALLDLMQFRKARNMEESNKPPTGQDIKGAGRIFEDAFACLILHRDIDEETRRMSTDVLLDLCKLRKGGSVGSTKGVFNTRRLSFEAEPEPEARDWYES